MTKEELALKISYQIYKGQVSYESFNSHQYISNYFADLSMDDLLGIAGQYGITVLYPDVSELKPPNY